MKNDLHRRASRAFTLAEMLVSSVLLVVVGGLSLTLLINGFVQFARNVALNQSAEQSRSTLTTVLRRMESAADNPQLVTLSGSPLALNQVATTYAPGVRFHRMIGGAYKITDPISTTSGSGATSLSYTSATTTTLTLSYNSSWPAPSVGDRVLFINPSNIKETVSGGTSPGTKPGRKIVAVGSAAGTNPRTVTVTLENSPGKPVLCNNPCYILREAALVAVDVSGRRELRYYDSTASLGTYTTLCRELDPNPSEHDTAGLVIQPFGLTTVSGRVQVLVDLPIRINDYQNTLTRFRKTDEFNGFLRTGSQVVLKTNLAIQ